MRQVAAYPLAKRIDLDESGIASREVYPYGWSKRGKRCHATRTGSRGKRLSFIAGVRQGHWVAPLVFEGNCDRPFFEGYIEYCLVPCLTSGDVVILDNVAFHKSKRIQALIEAQGAHLLFLAPYSPDFNPIEHC